MTFAGELSDTKLRPFVIRVSVHGYLSVAPHERVVIDHPITQRLRRISQTGMADLVFPEAKTSRFLHSLGAMNLASRFLVSCIENADAEIQDRFFAEIEKTFSENGFCSYAELDLLLDRTGAIAPLAATRAFFRNMDPKKRTIRRQLLVLVESGLRFAALFHDLGHLPFSHDGEYALQDYVKKVGTEKLSTHLVNLTSRSIPPHEEIGHRLADLAIAIFKEDKGAPTRAALLMGKKILIRSRRITKLCKIQTLLLLSGYILWWTER